MKTYPNILKPVKQYVLIGLIVLLTLLGLTLKANAQSSSLENDVNRIIESVVVQLVDHEFDVIIPKISNEELNTLTGATFNQMVYVADGAKGYYIYMGTKWELQNVREIFELIDINLTIQKPSIESLIIMVEGSNSKNLLDYNHHIEQIYQDFGFDTNDKVLAINIKKK